MVVGKLPSLFDTDPLAVGSLSWPFSGDNWVFLLWNGLRRNPSWCVASTVVVVAVSALLALRLALSVSCTRILLVVLGEFDMRSVVPLV